MSPIVVLFQKYVLSHTETHPATHCNTLQHTAAHCNTLQHTTIYCNTFCLVSEIRLVTRCNTLCNTLQQTPTHCNTLQHTATHCNTLQHTAKHCNTLQHTATYCNTLQNTSPLFQKYVVSHTATHRNTPHTPTRSNSWKKNQTWYMRTCTAHTKTPNYTNEDTKLHIWIHQYIYTYSSQEICLFCT